MFGHLVDEYGRSEERPGRAPQHLLSIGVPVGVLEHRYTLTFVPS